MVRVELDERGPDLESHLGEDTGFECAKIDFGFGTLLITTIKDHFPRRVVLQPEDGLALAAAVILVCVLSSGVGVRLAPKIDPATALGG